MSKPRSGDRGEARSSLLGNSSWNLVAFVFTLIANLATVPFVVRWIGLHNFGNAGIVIAVTAPLTLIGTVLGQATVRETSTRTGRGEYSAAFHVAAVALKTCLITSAISCAGLVLIGPWLMKSLTSSDASSSQNFTMPFLIAATGIFAQQISLVLQAISVGRQNFKNVAKASAWSSFVTILVTLGCTWFVPTLNGYLLGFAGSLVLSTLGWLLITRHIFRDEHVGPKVGDELNALLHFGKWQGISQLAGIFGNQMDRYVLASMAPAAVVGQYNICNRVQEAGYIATIRACEVLFPRFGSMSVSSETERFDFFLASSWVNAAFGAIMLSPIAILSRPLLTLWVGRETADAAGHLLQVLILGGVIGCSYNVFFYYAASMGKNAIVTIVSLAYSIMTVIFSIVFIGYFGPIAAGTGLLVATIIRSVLTLVMIRRRFFTTFGGEQMFASTVGPTVVGSVLSLVFYQAEFDWIDNWFLLGFAYVLFFGIVGMAIVLTAMSSKTGRIILSRIYSSVRSAITVRYFDRLPGLTKHKRGL
ncbi:lipopolysaccharide biosynthesis protein [Rhizobium mesosinicum]|uniref:Oligosaccharide flippase family protein n=1 Tax=Rhizobium mesosinicum TaxID=335017 RepID=A0ABS7GPH5_9HYPH|nr:oligosaccharide flippase family protein [Rhizobium mesosinicum]